MMCCRFFVLSGEWSWICQRNGEHSELVTNRPLSGQWNMCALKFLWRVLSTLNSTPHVHMPIFQVLLQIWHVSVAVGCWSHWVHERSLAQVSLMMSLDHFVSQTCLPEDFDHETQLVNHLLESNRHPCSKKMAAMPRIETLHRCSVIWYFSSRRLQKAKENNWYDWLIFRAGKYRNNQSNTKQEQRTKPKEQNSKKGCVSYRLYSPSTSAHLTRNNISIWHCFDFSFKKMQHCLSWTTSIQMCPKHFSTLSGNARSERISFPLPARSWAPDLHVGGVKFDECMFNHVHVFVYIWTIHFQHADCQMRDNACTPYVKTPWSHICNHLKKKQNK